MITPKVQECNHCKEWWLVTAGRKLPLWGIWGILMRTWTKRLQSWPKGLTLMVKFLPGAWATNTASSISPLTMSAICLCELLLLGLSKHDLSPHQKKVFATSKYQLSSIGMLKANSDTWKSHLQTYHWGAPGHVWLTCFSGTMFALCDWYLRIIYSRYAWYSIAQSWPPNSA